MERSHSISSGDGINKVVEQLMPTLITQLSDNRKMSPMWDSKQRHLPKGGRKPVDLP